MGIPSYEGKQVYMGLDVHREFFVSSCICDGVLVKRGHRYGVTAIKLRTQSPTSLFSSSAIKLKLSLIRVRLWYPPPLT